ncbi:MAG: hypothetical protein WCO93_07335 [bacterium]
MKNRKDFRRLFACLVIFTLALPLFGQKSDSLKKDSWRPRPYHWNVIKLNIMPMFMWSTARNITISYERLVNRSQSVSLQVGFLEMPRIIGDQIPGILYFGDSQKGGVNIAVDYRFYLSRRNSRPAPDGIYLGPFLSYYGYRFWNDFTLFNSSIIDNGKMKGGFDIINLGVSLGYQFVFWKRLTLDLLVFGPCMSLYSAKFAVTGDLSPEIIEQIDKDVLDKLLAKFPILGYLIHNDGAFATGYRLKYGAGFRYSIQLGFHF